MKKVVFLKGLLAIMLLVPGALPGCGEKDQTQTKPAAVPRKMSKRRLRRLITQPRPIRRSRCRLFGNRRKLN